MADQEFVTRVSVEGAETMRNRIEQIRKSFQNMDATTRTVSKGVAAFAGAFGVARGLQSFTRFLQSSVRDAATASEVNMRLATSMKLVSDNADAATQRIKAQANALQASTRFNDEAIKNAAAFLATFKMTSEEIEATLPRLLDMAEGYRNVTGRTMDLEQGAQMLGKAYQGMVTNLRRVGIMVDMNDYKTRGYVAVLEELDKEFRGQAAASAKTFAGELSQLTNVWSDFREVVGESIGVTLRPFIRGLTTVIQTVTKWADSIKIAVGGVLGLVGILATLGVALTATRMAIRVVRDEWLGVAGAANRAAAAQLAAGSAGATAGAAAAGGAGMAGIASGSMAGYIASRGLKKDPLSGAVLGGGRGRFAMSGKGAGAGIAGILAAITGMAIYSMGSQAARQGSEAGKSYWRNYGAMAGHAAGGALQGAVYGGMLGSFIPGVGTAIGAGVGAVGGAGIGLWAGSRVQSDAVTDSPTARAQMKTNELLQQISDLIGEQNRMIISGGPRARGAMNKGDIQRAIYGVLTAPAF